MNFILNLLHVSAVDLAFETEVYFNPVLQLFFILCKVVLTLVSADKMIMFDHSNGSH